jgi:membrane complex biogenesis BtpA family protein
MAAATVAPVREGLFGALFGRARGVAIGVVHLPALPGAPGWRGGGMGPVRERALTDAAAYAGAGFDSLIVENHGDIPFLKPDAMGHETAACMAILTERVVAETGLPVGVNVLANDAHCALAVAAAAGARFIRVNQWCNAYVANEGLIEGPAATALRYRRTLGAEEVAVFADSHVKHGSHAITADRSVAELTRDLEWSGADAVIATGQRTGDAARPEELAEVRGATALPVLVGSGVTSANAGAVLALADGVIVASALKEGGVWWNPVSAARCREFMAALTALR